MSLKKILSTTIIGSMVALSLVGCGGKANNSSNSAIKNYTPGSVEDKIINEGELTQEEVQKAVEQGIIQIN